VVTRSAAAGPCTIALGGRTGALRFVSSFNAPAPLKYGFALISFHVKLITLILLPLLGSGSNLLQLRGRL
jgi:hypothetical protein